MGSSDWITDYSTTPLGELAAVRLVCSTLARLFSYPSQEEAAVFTNSESLEYLFDLMEKALLVNNEMILLYEATFPDTEKQAQTRASLMRKIFTQLFYCPNAPIPLEGRYWIRRDPSAAGPGEEASVRQSYQAVGAHMRSGITERACALSTELDFVTYLLSREIECSQAGAGAQALIWKRRRLEFSDRHLLRFGCAVADRISQESSWSILLFWAEALRKIVQRCAL